METLGLKNVNFMSKSIFDSIEETKLDEIYAVEVSGDTQFKQMVASWGIPDYSAGIAISSGYVAQANGFVVLLSSGSGDDAMSKISVNGVLVSMTTTRAAYNQETSASAFVKKGDKITVSYNKFLSFTFYPLMGE